MQPKIQKHISRVQPPLTVVNPTIPVAPEVELKQYDLEKIDIQPFDETAVNYMKIMQEQNNAYAGLRQQEEQVRINLNTLRYALHEMKKMRPEELRSIYVPYLNGLRQITPERRAEFIKANIDQYHNYDIQYQSIRSQRQNRADELGESRLRVLKRLWDIMIHQHKMKEQDLLDIVGFTPFEDRQILRRHKAELPKATSVEIKADPDLRNIINKE